jgi:hypothetical protein
MHKRTGVLSSVAVTLNIFVHNKVYKIKRFEDLSTFFSIKRFNFILQALNKLSRPTNFIQERSNRICFYTNVVTENHFAHEYKDGKTLLENC